MYLPEPGAIRAKALELGLLQPDTVMTEDVRRQAIAALMGAADDDGPDHAPPDRSTVLSHSRIQVADGYLTVEIRHHPA